MSAPSSAATAGPVHHGSTANVAIATNPTA